MSVYARVAGLGAGRPVPSAVVISVRDGGSGHDGVGEHDGEGTVSGPLLWEEPTLLADKTGWGMWEEDKRQG